MPETVEYEAYQGSRTENVINRRTPGLTTDKLIDMFFKIGDLITGSPLYEYQKPFARRIFEAILEREAEEITALMARQCGKSQVLGYVCATLLVVMPLMSQRMPEDDRFNFYDVKSGTYRSYAQGFWIGIFAPIKGQATIIFNRIRAFLKRQATIEFLSEIGVSYDTNNGDTFRLSTGSRARCSTASDQSSIEGDTLHLAVMEESQDISDEKANKSIGPMLAATGGTLVKIGTANAKKTHFYNAIRRNIRRAMEGAQVCNFEVSWDIAAKYNTFYEKYVMKELARLGETSDEFQMNYMCRFMLERGQAVPERLYANRTVVSGTFSDILPAARRHMHYVAGIDFGKVHDSTVVTILEVNWDTPRQVVNGYDDEKGAFTVELYGKHVVDWLELQGDDYEAQYVEIKAFMRKWPIAKMTLDYTGVGIALGDRFKAMFDGVDVEFVTYSDDSKDMLCREFLADLHNGMLTWPGGAACQERREYKNFRLQMLDLEKEYRNGLLNLHHPEVRGCHDDYPQSLMLACHCAATRPFGGEIEETTGIFGSR